MQPGDELLMYGVLVGKAQHFIPRGAAITTANVKHAAKGFEVGERKLRLAKAGCFQIQRQNFYGISPGMMVK